MKCCNKELEIPQFKIKDVHGGPNLIIVDCPKCLQQWIFYPWTFQWRKLINNQKERRSNLMKLSKEIKEVIEKNLPAQIAGTLNDYLKKAKDAIEINEYFRGKEKESIEEKDALLKKIADLESSVSTQEEIKGRLKDIETRELALDKTVLEIKLQESEKRADAITSLTETVFKNRRLVIEKSSNVPLAIDGGNGGCVGMVQSGSGNETEIREEQ